MAVDGEAARPRGPRPGARRLRDISHLYLSQRPAPRAAPVWPQPAPRTLRLGLTGPAPGLARAEVCANLALQFARLGRRTLVVDLDPALPSLALRLGLEPRLALVHLSPQPSVEVERGLLGVRVVVGWAGRSDADVLPEAVREALGTSDVVLLHLPPLAAAARALRAAAPHLALPIPDTTVERAAAESPMFGAWLATAQRPRDARRTAPRPGGAPDVARIDGLLCVRQTHWTEAEPAEATALAALLAPAPFHRLVWGDGDAGPASSWAHVPAHPVPARLPLVAVDPEHPAARLYEGLAQSLLTGLARRGAPHA